MIQSSTIDDARAEATVDVARIAGRGTIYITLAKLWFIVSGYGIYFALPRLMSKEQFGLYQIVTTGIVSIVNAVIVTGTYQTVSKFVSQEEEKADAIKAKALKLQTVVGGTIALGFFLASPVIASLLNDTRLTNYFRLASLIPLAYAFYSVFTGYFNGKRKFLTQAALDIAYSTLKLLFIVTLAWLGYGVAGAVGGFALASAAVLLISAAVAGKGNPATEVRLPNLFKFQAFLLLFTLVLSLLQKVDLILIKALSTLDAKLASENAAEYGAAINVANITYQVIISATFVIFPLVSEATFAGDRLRTRSYISNTLRYTLIIMALTATLFSANASEVLHVIYPDEYQAGSRALSVVAFGMLFFGLLYVITTIISASGRPTVSLIIGAVTLCTSAALNAALIPTHGLVGAAVGTTVAMIAGAIAGSGYLLVKFGALLPVLSLARITLCAGFVYAASLVVTPTSRLAMVVQLAVLALLYFGALVLSKEIGRGEMEMLKRVIRR